VNNDPSWNFDFYLGRRGDFHQVDFVINGFWTSVWWVTGALSLFRIACLWIGYFSMKTSGLDQVFGYFMVLCTLPEALLVRQIREQPIL
jgi:hypothetical protein